MKLLHTGLWKHNSRLGQWLPSSSKKARRCSVKCTTLKGLRSDPADLTQALIPLQVCAWCRGTNCLLGLLSLASVVECLDVSLVETSHSFFFFDRTVLTNCSKSVSIKDSEIPITPLAEPKGPIMWRSIGSSEWSVCARDQDWDWTVQCSVSNSGSRNSLPPPPL